MWKLLFLVSCFVVFVASRPQGADEQPTPYEYTYEVKDQEKELFHDKNEVGDASGKVVGKYSVLLPDGRLMTVEYTVESAESGFNPKITFTENASPFG